MRLTDRMIENTKELNKQLKKQNDIQQDVDEDETGMAYAPREMRPFLNEEKGVFDTGVMGEGINTAKSVFDRTAVFHVKDGNE